MAFLGRRSSDGTLRLQTGQPTGPTLKGDGTEIAALCFAGGQRDQVFAITVRDTLLDWPDGKTVRRTLISNEELHSAQCLPDRPLWRALSEGNTIIEVNLGAPVPTSRTLFRLNARGSEFSADGRYIVGVDHEVFTADVTDLEHKSTRRVKLAGRPVPINMIQANADGSLLAIMEAGAPQIRLYRTRSGFTAPFTLQPPGAVIALEFSADSSMIAMSMTTGAVGVVGTEALALRRQLRAAGADADAVFPVVFDRGGHVLLAGANNGRVVQWDPDPLPSTRSDAPAVINIDDALARLCGIANRQLSDAEVRDLLGGQPPARTCASLTQTPRMMYSGKVKPWRSDARPAQPIPTPNRRRSLWVNWSRCPRSWRRSHGDITRSSPSSAPGPAPRMSLSRRPLR